VHETNRQELAERLYRLTTHLVRNSGTEAVGLLDEMGVRPSQLKALHILAYAEGPLTVTRLAELLAASQPTASRTVASLGRLGLVSCEVSESDRRSRELTVSDAGRAMVARLAAARTRDLSIFTDGLDEAAARRLSAALNQIDLATGEGPITGEVAA
jgi:DNA-binding MarR family transcriptional regulator